MFEIEQAKIIHRQEGKNFTIETEADVIANLRAISEKKKQTLEERNDYMQSLKEKRISEIAEAKEKIEEQPIAYKYELDDTPDDVRYDDEPDMDNAPDFDDEPDLGGMPDFEEPSGMDVPMTEPALMEKPVRTAREEMPIAKPEVADDVRKAELQEDKKQLQRERLLAKYGRKPNGSGNFSGSTGGVNQSSSAPMSSAMAGMNRRGVGNGAMQTFSVDIDYDIPEEKHEKTREEFEAELKARIKQTEERVQKVEELKEHSVSSDGGMDVVKTDDVAETLEERNKDENKKEEIERILKQREAELKKYEPLRTANEKKASFSKPKKQLTGGKKWLIACAVALAFCVFCGMRANGYCYDTYGDCSSTYNHFTGEYETVSVSGLGCLLSSFTVDSVSLFPPVFNAPVFGTAFGVSFGVCAVAILLIWSGMDTKKRNRDGKEHGNSKIMSPTAIKKYQRMFMDCTNLK